MKNAFVMGGSLGGLTAALLLDDLGFRVEVFERASRPLEGRGAGIVLHPATIRYLVQSGGYAADQIGAPARRLRYVDRQGTTAAERPCAYRFISFSWLYEQLLGRFGLAKYHLGSVVRRFDQDDDGVTVDLLSGEKRRCDLLVCADGVNSTAREILVPTVAPHYAGYVGWRGTVSEELLSHSSFGAFGLHQSLRRPGATQAGRAMGAILD